MKLLRALVIIGGLTACVPMGEIHDRAAVQEQVGEVTRFGDVALRELAPGVWQHTTYLDLPGIGPVPSNGLLVWMAKPRYWSTPHGQNRKPHRSSHGQTAYWKNRSVRL